jgi:hypothetical protein
MQSCKCLVVSLNPQFFQQCARAEKSYSGVIDDDIRYEIAMPRRSRLARTPLHLSPTFADVRAHLHPSRRLPSYAMTRPPSRRLNSIGGAFVRVLRRGTTPPSPHEDTRRPHGGVSSPKTSLSVPIETGDFVIVSCPRLSLSSQTHAPAPRQNEFFSDNGEYLLVDVNPLRELPPSHLSDSPPDVIPLTDTLSTLDVGIASSKPLTLLLSEFCSLVARHQSLQNADILTTEVHTEQIGAIPHKFLLLEIRRSSGQPIWLRLDRRTGRTALRVMVGIGVVPAHDVVSYVVRESRFTLLLNSILGTDVGGQIPPPRPQFS